MRLIRLCFTLAVAAPAVTRAQEPTIVDRILAAASLPGLIDSLRLHGVPENDARTILDDLLRRGIPATETRVVLEQADRDVKDRGPVNNLGAFVQSQLDAGLRGRALADAIHAEHQRRGIGKGKRLDAGKARSRGDSMMRGGPPASKGGPPAGRGPGRKP